MQTVKSEIAGWIQEMDRPELKRLLTGLRCEFPLDFTDEFFNSASVERLRHVALAAVLHARQEIQPGVFPGQDG